MAHPPCPAPRPLSRKDLLTTAGLTGQQQELLDPRAHRLSDLGVASGVAVVLGVAGLLATVPGSRGPLGLAVAATVLGFVAVLQVRSDTAIALICLGVPAFMVWTLVQIVRSECGAGPLLLLLGLAALGLTYAGLRGWRRFRCRRLGLDPLKGLLVELERYNRLVLTFQARRALALAEGVATDPEQGLRVNQTLQEVRRNLERAAAVANVLRTHRDVLQGGATLLGQIKPFAPLQLESHAGHYADILDQALQMAVAVQAELAQVDSGHR